MFNLREEIAGRNKQKFIEYLQKHNMFEDEESLNRRMSIIPESSREILETRWGLDGGKVCTTYKLLNKKMGVEDSQKLYFFAEKDLANARFVELLVDFKEFGYEQWNLAVGLGALAEAILGKSQVNSVYGKKLLEIIYSISERERKILELRFGLVDGKMKTFKQVAQPFRLTGSRIQQIESKALKNLRKRYAKYFYLPAMQTP